MEPEEPEDYVEDFQALNTEPIMSLDRIEWWLLKYSDIHADILDYFEQWGFSYDPNIVVYTEFQDKIMSPYIEFLEFYNFLNEITICSKKEAFFKKELMEYRQVLHSREKTTEWLAKNEEVGFGFFPEFIWEYFEYGEVGGELWIGDQWNDVGFLVDWNQFCFTLYFYRLFKVLFWDHELLPHRLPDAKDRLRKAYILFSLKYYGE